MKTRILLSVVGAIASLSALGSARPMTGSSPSGVDTVLQSPSGPNVSRYSPPFATLQAPVFLGRAAHFVILAKAGISTTGATTIAGHVGASPISSTGLTGFGLVMDPSGMWSASSLVTGRVFAPDYALRTQQHLTSTISDMDAAYNDAAGRLSPDFSELGAGNIGGMVLAPGLYKWSTGVTIPSSGVAISGGATDVWVFQIAQGLTVDSGAVVALAGGAQTSNVFWQVAGQTTLGMTSAFKGVVLCKTAIVLDSGAALLGRAFAQTAVTLDGNAVSPQ